MAATGTTYTQVVSFGVSTGPTYQGQVSVPPTATGTENYRNYSAQVLAGVSAQVLDASGFVDDNWLAMGFLMQVDPVQSGTPTAAQLLAATVTIKLKGCCAGVTDYTITLNVGQSVSWVVLPAAIVANATSITVDGDANVDCDVYGILLLSA
jgi:hypothetical protein